MEARGALLSRCRASCAQTVGSMVQTLGKGPKLLTVQDCEPESTRRVTPYATLCRIMRGVSSMWAALSDDKCEEDQSFRCI